jgi:DNA modification methylase
MIKHPMERYNIRDITNKILSGDTLTELKRIPDKSIDFAFFDPPYNVGKDYGVCKDSMTHIEYIDLMYCIVNEVKRVSVDFAIYPPKIHLLEFWKMMPEKHMIVCAWSPEGAMRSNFVHQYVPLLVPSKPLKRTKDHWWNVQVSGLGFFYREEKFNHPGQTSMDITKRVLDAFTTEGQTILDCYNGIGTTSIACKELGRNFIGIEINDEYNDIARKRITEYDKQLKIF